MRRVGWGLSLLRRPLAHPATARFLDRLAHFARQRLAEEVLGAVRHAYALLAGKLAERSRDMGFVRQRLRHLHENLEHGPADSEEEVANTRPVADYTMTRSPVPSSDSFWEAIRQSATARVVLPDGETDLELRGPASCNNYTPSSGPLWTRNCMIGCWSRAAASTALA